MVDEETVDEMRAFVPALLSAVGAGNLDQIRETYRLLSDRYQTSGGHAVVVLLADTLLTERAKHRVQLARVNGEATRYAAAYMDEKRRADDFAGRVRELRGIVDAHAASADPGIGRMRRDA